MFADFDRVFTISWICGMLGTAAPSAAAPTLAFFRPLLPRRRRGLVWGVSSSSVKMPSQGKGPADQIINSNNDDNNNNTNKNKNNYI